MADIYKQLRERSLARPLPTGIPSILAYAFAGLTTAFAWTERTYAQS